MFVVGWIDYLLVELNILLIIVVLIVVVLFVIVLVDLMILGSLVFGCSGFLLLLLFVVYMSW